MADRPTVVQAIDIGKSFAATRALDGVSLSFYKGEILGLVGANGAGKSTLIKIICGYHTDYEGSIVIGDEVVRFTSPEDAYGRGIATVHQIINQGVVQSMSVGENLTLGELIARGKGPFYSKTQLKTRAQEIQSQLNLDLDLDLPVEDIGQSDRQMIAIARALSSEPKLLILDEPTSSLSEKESERLFTTLKRLRSTGVSIVYVSHRLHEVKRIADRVAVIRDGRLATVLEHPYEVKHIVTAMVGEMPEHEVREQRSTLASREVRLELRDLVVEPGTPPLNLKLYEGEIVGITGLIGAGKSELAEVLFGVRQPVSGEILIDGEPYRPGDVYDAIRAGVFLVPEDRANNAVIPDFTVCQNITAPFLRDFQAFGIMKVGEEREASRRMIKAMGIKAESEVADMDSLSGGNQQKVVVARWLLKNFRLVLLDEPFQGVDIKSRHDIGQYLRDNIGDRTAVVIATDLDEVIEVADRILVMNGGAIVGEQFYATMDRGKLLQFISEDNPEPVETT
ncbi:MAG: sugar ABC transporter ATP-binding protein [Spirochaetaceae bacterium]